MALEELKDAEPVVGDEGERALNCIVQNVLLAPKQPTLSQRHALSKTRYTVQKKICDVIESGSTEKLSLRH